MGVSEVFLTSVCAKDDDFIEFRDDYFRTVPYTSYSEEELCSIWISVDTYEGPPKSLLAPFSAPWVGSPTLVSRELAAPLDEVVSQIKSPAARLAEEVRGVPVRSDVSEAYGDACRTLDALPRLIDEFTATLQALEALPPEEISSGLELRGKLLRTWGILKQRIARLKDVNRLIRDKVLDGGFHPSITRDSALDFIFYVPPAYGWPFYHQHWTS